MKIIRSAALQWPTRAPNRAPTGITGFDEIAGGGLLSGRTAVLQGGPDSGATSTV